MGNIYEKTNRMGLEKRNCSECKSPFLGRADKKFCSADCRSSHNNRMNRNANNYVRKVNGILRRNRRILEDLNPEGKTRVMGKTLRSAGFQFDYHTSVYRTKKGAEYYFTYEHGYLALDNDYFMLVRRE